MMVEHMSKQEMFSLEKKKLEMAAKKLQLEQQKLELEMMKMDWQYNTSDGHQDGTRTRRKESATDGGDDYSVKDRSGKQRFEKLSKSRKEAERSSSGNGKPHRSDRGSDQISSRSDHGSAADGAHSPRSDGRPSMGMRSSSWYVRREGLSSHDTDDDRRHPPKPSASRRSEDPLKGGSSHGPDGMSVDSRKPRRRGSSVEAPSTREKERPVSGDDVDPSRPRRRRGSSVEAPVMRRSSSVEMPRRRGSSVEAPGGRSGDYNNSNHSDERRQRGEDSNRRKTDAYDDGRKTSRRSNPASSLMDDGSRHNAKPRRSSISCATVHSHVDEKRRRSDDEGRSPGRSSGHSVMSSRRRDRGNSPEHDYDEGKSPVRSSGHSVLSSRRRERGNSSPEHDDDDGKTVGTAKTSASSFKSVRDITWPDGRRYCGGWYDGKCHGKGTYIWPDGSKYIGQYKDGIRHGQGTFIGKDGSKYEGDFRDGKRCGRGVQYNPNGSVYHDGKWKDNKPST